MFPIYQRRRLFLYLSCVLATPLIGGCSESMNATVRGRVTYNGQPVEGAILQFGYVGEGSSAQAITIDDGQYQVRTGSHVGASVGEYELSISPAEAGSIPQKYTDSKRSGLTFQFEPGRNTIDIELTDE